MMTVTCTLGNLVWDAVMGNLPGKLTSFSLTIYSDMHTSNALCPIKCVPVLSMNEVLGLQIACAFKALYTDLLGTVSVLSKDGMIGEGTSVK